MTPTLQFSVEITNVVEGERILSMSLSPEVHLDIPPRGIYWGSVATTVSRFAGNTTVTIPVPCSQEADLQVTAYLEKKRPVAAAGLVLVRVICKACRSERERLARPSERTQVVAAMSGESCSVCGNLAYEVQEHESGQTGAGPRAGSAIPFRLVFYGSAVYQTAEDGPFYFWPFPQLPPKEASFSVTAEMWRTLMQEHFGESRWVRVSAETFHRLEKFRQARQLRDLSKAVEDLLGSTP